MATDAQLPGLEDHPDNRGVFVELWVLDLLGCDYPVAVLLSQLLWWHQPAKDGGPKLSYVRDGHRWLVRRDDAWARETRLTLKQVRRAKSVLVNLGVVECRAFRISGAPTSAWRPRHEAIRALRDGHLMPLPEPVLSLAGQNGNVPGGTNRIAPAGTNGNAPGGTNPLPYTTSEVQPQRSTTTAADAASAPPERARNLPFEALCEVCRMDWNHLTDVERRRTAAALKQVRGAWSGDDLELAREIGRRAHHYLTSFEVPLTPMALAGRWAGLEHPPPMGERRRLTGTDRGLEAAERWLRRREPA